MDLNSPISPEWLDLAIRHDNTAERDQSHDDQRIDERSKDGIRRVRCDRLPDGRVQEFVHHLESYMSVELSSTEFGGAWKLTMAKKTLPAEYGEVFSPGAKYQQT